MIDTRAKPWRIIFLDVDGVLNHKDCPGWQNVAGDNAILAEDCVQNLKDACDTVGAKIVVSSVWRHNPRKMALLLEYLEDRIIGVTPAVSGGIYQRHLEITAWINAHAAIPLEVLVIDDEDDARCPGLAFLKTDFEKGGLNLDCYFAILKTFGIGTNEKMAEALLSS